MLPSLLNVVADIWNFLFSFEPPEQLRHRDPGTLYICGFYDTYSDSCQNKMDEIILAYRRAAVCRMWLDKWRVTVHDTMLHKKWEFSGRLFSHLGARVFQRMGFGDPFFYCWSRRLLLAEGRPRWETLQVIDLDVDVVLDSERIDRESDDDVLNWDDEYGVWRGVIKCSLGHSNHVGQKFCGECGRRLRKYIRHTIVRDCTPS
jgi:hypothetical protein